MTLKKRLKIILALIFSCCSLTLSAMTFSSGSPFASGKWVKIAIDKTGVYEVTYDELREMGFSNPSKVGVCGDSPEMRDLNFADASGTQLYTDNLTPIAVRHSGEKIYFYVRGVDYCTFNPESSSPFNGYFRKTDRNIYTDNARYFLTDCSEYSRSIPAIESLTDEQSKLVNSAVGHIFHEQDIYQNQFGTGQLFWGEKLNGIGDAEVKFPYTLNRADITTPAVMQCVVYCDVATDKKAKVTFGAVGGESNPSYTVQVKNSSNVYPQSKQVALVNLPASKGELFVQYSSSVNTTSYANLDFWTLSYKRTIPMLSDANSSPLPAEEFVLGDITDAQVASFYSNVPAGSILLDITKPDDVEEILADDSSGLTKVTLRSKGDGPRLLYFNPALEQMKITGYQKVENAGLHEAAGEGADFLIITTRNLREQADMIADLHARKEGLKVLVTDVEDVYNEFSAGMPDPMAYRALAKLLYSHENRPLQNILLFGPVTGNCRSYERVSGHLADALIAFESPTLNAESGAFNINDFYGMMSEYFVFSNIMSQKMEVGVGVLPVRTVEEASNVTDKIRRYLFELDHTPGVNDNVLVAGLYDVHMHGNHALNLYDAVNRSRSGEVVPEVISIDAYGEKNARSKFFSAFNRGASLLTYIGHGAPDKLGKNANFFSISDLKSFHNQSLPLLFIAGCEISYFDREDRGIGEALVISNSSGSIGTLLATRSTWATQNLSLMRSLLLNIYKDSPSPTSNSPVRKNPVTIGEALRLAKNLNQGENKFAYQLVCDPALKVPVAYRSVSVVQKGLIAVPGETLTFDFEVLNDQDKKDVDFNGNVVVKFMTPIVKKISDDFVTNTKVEYGETLNIAYTDVVAMANCTVENGVGSVSIQIPASLSSRVGESFNVQIGAFDSDRFIGAAGKVTAKITGALAGSAGSDQVSPVIGSVEYDESIHALSVEMSDNKGFYSGYSDAADYFKIKVDGHILSDAAHFVPQMSPDGLSMKRIIPLAPLGSGKHSALISVKDAAGNTASAQTTFTIGGFESNIRFSLMDKAVYEKGVFDTSEISDFGASIVITDAEGKRVISIPISRAKTIWNRKNSQGNKVPAGMYKAHIEIKERTGHVFITDVIDVPVV